MPYKVVMGVTGASGAVYAKRLLSGLTRAGAEVHLVVSDRGQEVMAEELGTVEFGGASYPGSEPVKTYRNDDLMSPLSSGSFRTDGMVICPCSCNTLSAIAAGRGDNLIVRAAHVHLKERRRLILCVREMPLTKIDLRNMLTATEAGAVVCPASPPFYGHPKELDDVINAVAGKLLDLLGIPNDLAVRWLGSSDERSVSPDHYG